MPVNSKVKAAERPGRRARYRMVQQAFFEKSFLFTSSCVPSQVLQLRKMNSVLSSCLLAFLCLLQLSGAQTLAFTGFPSNPQPLGQTVFLTGQGTTDVRSITIPNSPSIPPPPNPPQ